MYSTVSHKYFESAGTKSSINFFILCNVAAIPGFRLDGFTSLYMLLNPSRKSERYSKNVRKRSDSADVFFCALTMKKGDKT